MTELAVVLAILGFVSAIGIPSFIGIMPRIRLNSNAMVLSNEIAVARMRAISKSNKFRIVFDADHANEGYTPWIYQGGTWRSLGMSRLTGNWSAKYSCDAINAALGGFGYGTKIAWHRLR